MKTTVVLNNKFYHVDVRENGYVSISTQWDVIVPSTAQSAHPTYCSRYASINPSGALGKKIMAQVKVEA